MVRKRFKPGQPHCVLPTGSEFTRVFSWCLPRRSKAASTHKPCLAVPLCRSVGCRHPCRYCGDSPSMYPTIEARRQRCEWLLVDCGNFQRAEDHSKALATRRTTTDLSD